MRAVRPDDDAVALACGSGGAHRRNRALAGTEERASAKFSAASSCGLSNIMVQIENITPDRPNFEPRGYNPSYSAYRAVGRAREFSSLAPASPLKRLKTAMGGSCKSSGSAPWGRRRFGFGSSPISVGERSRTRVGRLVVLSPAKPHRRAARASGGPMGRGLGQIKVPQVSGPREKSGLALWSQAARA